MNEAIRQIVERIWVNHIGIPPEWTQQQAETFLRSEADRLSEMIGQLQIETQHAMIREWRAAHHGAEPDYLTQVGLINTARAQAEEIVLSQELYEQVPEEVLTVQEQADQKEWEAEVRARESYFRLRRAATRRRCGAGATRIGGGACTGARRARRPRRPWSRCGRTAVSPSR